MKSKTAKRLAMHSKYSKVIKKLEDMLIAIEMHSKLGYTNCGFIVKDSNKDKLVHGLEILGYEVHASFRSDGDHSCIEVEWH